MNVLLCITGLNRGGAEKNFIALCTKTSRFGYPFSPTVASWIAGSYANELNKENIPTFTLLKPAGLLSIVMNFRSYIAYLFKHRRRFDVVQAFMPHGGLLAILSNFILRKPFIYCIRNSQIHAESHKNPLKWLIRCAAHHSSVYFASVVTCNTPFVKAVLDNKVNKDVRLVFNAVEKPDEEKYHDSSIQEAFFRPGGYHIVSICNMRHPQKDILTLLKVAKKLGSFRFILVGDGNGLSLFKNEAQRLELDNVVFAGAYENIYPFLSHADQYILLTGYEGFPNTVLEAMVSRVPVIMSDIREMSGILAHGKNCLLVKNGDIADISIKILSLKEDGVLCKNIVENGYLIATTQFTMANLVGDNFKIYTSLTSTDTSLFKND